jgi:decaprenylphospho-beta-D-ribofuranose 2-oxidase
MAHSLAILSGWGRVARSASVTWRPDAVADLAGLFRESARAHGLIAHGAGRAYGDCALNAQGVALLSAGLDRVIAFDPATGDIQVEPGVTFRRLMATYLPQGWLVPVSPGTGYATIGGAVANDVHGKNHEAAGSFCAHVTGLDLLTPDGATRTIGPGREDPLFRATCGGLGLTGVITRVAFRMKRVPGPGVAVRSRRLSSLDSFLAAMDAAKDATYAVGWIDGCARGASLGRGILETAEPSGGACPPPPAAGLRVPFDLPAFVLGPASVSAFNALYYRRAPASGRVADVPYVKFFYPLDALRDWNRIYGKRGFHQFQNVVPFESGDAALRDLLGVIAESRRASFLAVLKRLGPAAQDAGPLSFPQAGYTLALDFPAGPGIEDLYARLVDITLTHGGRVYLAKDALLTPDAFRAMYPRWREFVGILDQVDPARRLQSDMSRRLRLREPA